MPHPPRPGVWGRSARLFWAPVLLLAAAAASGCGDDLVTDPSDQTPPTAVTETFEGTLTVNGAITQPFVVQTAGTVSAQLSALEPTDATIGLSIGTWNGVTCAIGAGALANDNATVGSTVTGSATATGNYCARVYDVGKLTGPANYQIIVTHF
jgi:hypothetical protein